MAVVLAVLQNGAMKLLAGLVALSLASGCSREHVVHATIDGPSQPSSAERALALEAHASAVPEVTLRAASTASGRATFDGDASTYRALLPPGAAITSALVRAQGLRRPPGLAFALQTREERVWKVGSRRGGTVTLPLGDNHNGTPDGIQVPVGTTAKHLVLEATNVRDGEDILPDVLTICVPPAEGERSFSCAIRFESLTSQRPLELTFDLAATAYDRCADETCAPPTGARPRMGSVSIAY